MPALRGRFVLCAVCFRQRCETPVVGASAAQRLIRGGCDAGPDGQAQAAPGGNRGSPPFGTAEVVALPGQSSRGPVLFASAWARASL